MSTTYACQYKYTCGMDTYLLFSKTLVLSKHMEQPYLNHEHINTL